MTPIASVGGLEESLTWETQTDWNNATSQTDTIAEGGIIWLDLGRDGWEDYATGSLPAHLNDENQGNDRVVNTRSLNGSNSVKSDITAGNVGNLLWSASVRTGQYNNDLIFVYQETSDSTIYAITPLTSSGDQLFSIGTNNPQPAIDDGDGSRNLLSTSTVDPSYDEWRRWTITIDWVNQTYDATWDDITGNTSSTSVSNRSLKSATTFDIDKIGYSLGGPGSVWGGDDTDTWNDDTVAKYASSGSLQTATKSFSGAETPDFADLSYTLNGESITLVAIGSPGTASEEQQSVSLDGSADFNLSWNNSHTDFQIRPELSTASPLTTPTFDSGTLS